MNTEEKHSPSKIARDINAIITSIVVAYLLMESGAFDKFLTVSIEWKIIGIFIAGLFFTSLFTVAISAVTLAEIALTTNVLTVALIGGLGAALGDLIIFRFLETHIAEDVEELIKYSKRIKFVFKFRFFRFLIPFIGALVIASPLPDEIGLAMMGIVHLKPKFLIPISFVLNSFGILIIGLIARGLL